MMKFTHFFISLFLIVTFLSGCVHQAPKEASWPNDMPSRRFFIAAFDADSENKQGQDVENYLLWVIRFYKGWELYSNGWTQTTTDSLIGVKDPVLAQEIKSKMDLIGSSIAVEWAKNKKDRRILTRHVVVWGNALIESIKRDEELMLINRVLNDINGLMENKIDIDDVKAERYYAKDKDDIFG
jgi:hypothetical protein